MSTGRYTPLRWLFLITCMQCLHIQLYAQAPQERYLDEVKAALTKTWPANRAINLVFHGHSVPAGYFRTPEVRTLEAYPHQVLVELKKLYPTAVINVIVTAIGGENSVQGQKRFSEEVLVHHPDVIFIDYALNDRSIGLAKAREATASMVVQATQKNIPVILLTPSPDLHLDIRQRDNILEQFAVQLRALAAEHGVGVADSYDSFKSCALRGEDLARYMSQSNHPNAKGHALIALEVMKFFR